LEKNLGSIVDLTRLPSALFIVDIEKEHIAVKEAHRLNIPVFAITDTNTNPNDVDYAIPANDDAKDSVEVILNAMCDAINEGLTERKAEKADEKAAAEQEDKPRIKKVEKVAEAAAPEDDEEPAEKSEKKEANRKSAKKAAEEAEEAEVAEEKAEDAE
jgi:small subunit ribosomal protein S2